MKHLTFTLLTALVLAPLAVLHAATINLVEPLDYQVIQRTSPAAGPVRLRGTLTDLDANGATWEARIVANGKPGEWQRIAARLSQNRVEGTLAVPAGGWYRLEVRVLRNGAVVADAAVEHVGVGEVFVVAGQSNSANFSEEKQVTKSRRVAAFAGNNWQIADDPQPGAGGKGGSFMPPLGDEIVRRFNVPVGVIACGIGATSAREWLPKGTTFPNPPTLLGRVEKLPDGQWSSKGDAFAMFVTRMKQAGPRGFRAVLWHQGESDANQTDPTRTLPGNLYREYLEKLIRDSRREIGWDAPWFVTQVPNIGTGGGSARREVKLAAIFSNHLVLQREQPVPVWGWEPPGEEVTVEFAGQKRTARSDAAGKWLVRLDPLKVNAEPQDLKVNGLVIHKVVVGDVWLCSGQSNMAMTINGKTGWLYIGGVANAKEEVRNSANPSVRQFYVDWKTDTKPQENCTGKWTVASPDTAANFTATGYFFARELQRRLQIPIGIISASFGGSSVEGWTSREALAKEADAEFGTSGITSGPFALVPYNPKFQAVPLNGEWQCRAEKVFAPLPKDADPTPVAPVKGPLHWMPVPSQYNAMLHPLIPYAIKGVAWHQGESNVGNPRYAQHLKILINDWRRRWGRDDLPFYLCQLAGFGPRKTAPADSAWAECREMQTTALALTHTGIANLINTCEDGDLHPLNKQDAGHRLAWVALANTYGFQDLAWTGPVFDALKIEGRTVVVWSDQVQNPIAVRYAWADHPVCNLDNQAGLPAFPFRTDRFPWVSEKDK